MSMLQTIPTQLMTDIFRSSELVQLENPELNPGHYHLFHRDPRRTTDTAISWTGTTIVPRLLNFRALL